MTQKTQWSTIVKFFGRKLFEDEMDDSSNNCDETSHWNEKKQRCVPIIDHPQLVDGGASAAQNLSKEASTASKEAFAQEIPKKKDSADEYIEKAAKAAAHHKYASDYHKHSAEAYKKIGDTKKAQYHIEQADAHSEHQSKLWDLAHQRSLDDFDTDADLVFWQQAFHPPTHETAKKEKFENKLKDALGQTHSSNRVALKSYQPAKGVPGPEEPLQMHEKWGKSIINDPDKPFLYKAVAGHLHDVDYKNISEHGKHAAIHVIHQATREHNNEDTEWKDELSRRMNIPKKIGHKEGEPFQNAHDPDVIKEHIPHNLPITTMMAAKYYTRAGDEHINGLLRKGKDSGLSDAEKQAAHEAIPHIDTLTRAHRLKRSLLLHRGAAFDKDTLNQILKPGHTFTDQGFTSTSGTPDFADEVADEVRRQRKGSHPVRFEIEAPKGSHGVNLARHSSFIGENEFLLPRGSAFTTISHKKDGRKHVVRVRLNTPEAAPDIPEKHWKKPLPKEMNAVAKQAGLRQGASDIIHGRGTVRIG